jgi:8-oxo-dGTP pyrophosphatase MutT (NUDIX family)
MQGPPCFPLCRGCCGPGGPRARSSSVTDPARAIGIRRALSAFQPMGPEQEHALARVELLLADEQVDPFDRSQVRPGHLTASGLVLMDDDQSLLLIFHRKLDRWLQPGGHFEVQDVDHVAAARREVSEEVGIDQLEVISPLYDLDVHAIPANAREGEHLHFDLRVLFRCKQRSVVASEEVADARSFRLTDLASAREPTVGSDDSVARVAKRLLTRAR